MKILTIALALVLTGCSTVVPVTAKFPEPPGLQAQTRCPQLKKTRGRCTAVGCCQNRYC